MQPISNERALFLEARIFLLGRMIQEFTLRQSRYQQPRNVNHHSTVMNNMIAEQLQLRIELNALEEYLAEYSVKQNQVPEIPNGG